jgi:predicted nucleotidyltransferase
MGALTDLERDCLRRFCELMCARLGDGLREVRMFGSAARGDMWPARSPMHSDIDLLIVTGEPVPAEDQEHLLNETYPTRDVLRRVEGDCVPVWQSGW